MNRALAPAIVGGVSLRNRVIKAATFEGMSPDGRVSDALVEHHRRLAAGGVGMSTVAYGAVEPEGRTFPRQLLVAPDAGLARIPAAVHAAGGRVSLQLAHAGGFSKMPGPRGPSARINLYGLATGVPWVRAMTRDDLSRVCASFHAAATLARDAGFDAVELHVGHGYLLHQFLSPVTNRRTDGYGGDLHARLRFPLEVLFAVRAAGLPVWCKMNLADGHPGGLDVDDAVVVAEALASGGADALVLSGGVVDRTPFFLLRGETPIREMAEVETHPLQKLALRLFAPFRVKKVPYTPMFFLEMAGRVRARVAAPLVLLGGVTDAAHLDRAMEAGFDAVQVGRALLHDPDWVQRAAAPGWQSACTHCNRCVAEMDRDGVRCVEPPAPV